MDEKRVEEAWGGLQESYETMGQQQAAVAPKCHFRPMLYERDDVNYRHVWWECSVCGHTKPAYE